MRYFLLLCLLMVSAKISAQIHLSENAKVSIITCAPDQNELYAAFGHSAIRVYDPENNIDYAYNYGTFDFNQPNFYLNFTKGNLLYRLAVQSYPRFRSIYLYYNRWVHEQVLDLNQNQKQQVFDFLQWNALPENQDYLYDYFYNNCATIIRDVFVKVLGENIRFDDSHINTNYTIRELTDLYLKDQPWGDLGIDICLGLPMDKKASPYEYMFLPDYIEKAFDHASIMKETGPSPIVLETIVSDPDQAQVITHSVPHPWVIFGVAMLLTIVISFFDYKKQRPSRWLDVTMLSITGLIGWLLLLLWIATDHKAAANNFNILWAIPTNLIAVFMLFAKRKALVTKYFGLAAALTLLVLASWPFLPQQLNVYLIPLVIALGIRYGLNYWLSKSTYE